MVIGVPTHWDVAYIGAPEVAYRTVCGLVRDWKGVMGRVANGASVPTQTSRVRLWSSCSTRLL